MNAPNGLEWVCMGWNGLKRVRTDFNGLEQVMRSRDCHPPWQPPPRTRHRRWRSTPGSWRPCQWTCWAGEAEVHTIKMQFNGVKEVVKQLCGSWIRIGLLNGSGFNGEKIAWNKNKIVNKVTLKIWDGFYNFYRIWFDEMNLKYK